MVKDPVCGKRMGRGKAIIEYEGEAYSLCCPKYQAEFEQTPERYDRPELGTRVKNKKRLPHRK